MSCLCSHQGADCTCSLLPAGAHPGVCCDVLAPWHSSTSDPLPPAVHNSALTQQPSNYCTDFHLRRGPGEATAHPCTGLSWYLSRKADPDFSIKVLPTLCLRLPGESKTENQDAGFQQLSSTFKKSILSLFTLLLCTVFKAFFFFFFYPFDSTRITCQQFVPKYSAGVRRWWREAY